ncbi:phosphoglycerate kinase, partial [Chryseobacterium cucumeris]|uniref:phosphoglycerate kinase n=1 Tax=Chryseobacterium cucumeris TaxID=1813611 RepID=UPI0023F5887B
MQLYNTLSAEERAQLIDEAGKDRLTLSFYAYAKIEDPKKFRDELFIAWNALDALGRIYVATEGINAQMSVPADQFEAFRDTLEVYDFMKGIRLNVAVDQDNYSFLKLTIKVRNKIVADGLNDETFDVTNKGIHLKAQEFNNMLEDPNTIVVDFRNHYESEVGHFEGAITPDVENFRESLPIINEQLQDFKEETDNDENFSKKLGSLAEIYVNDAFSCSHRKQASIYSITKFVKKAYAGPLLEKEIKAIDLVIKNKKEPVTCIIGGSKVSTKIGVITNLIQKSNNIIIVGAMANNFIAYNKHNVGKSLVEENSENIIKKILEEAKKNNCRIIIPEDYATSKSFDGEPELKNNQSMLD